MSFQSDAETVVDVIVSGASRAALIYDGTQWYTKNQDGDISGLVPDATPDLSGIVNITTQGFGGIKTFVADETFFFNGALAFNIANVSSTLGTTPALVIDSTIFPNGQFSFVSTDTYTDITSTNINFVSGDQHFDGAVAPTGSLYMSSGNNFAAATTGGTGPVLLASGNIYDSGSIGDSGFFLITSGYNGGLGNSGPFELLTGNAVNGSTGGFTIASGNGTLGPSGPININTGTCFDPTNDSDSGLIAFFSGNTQLGSSGAIQFITGNSESANSGDIIFATGVATGRGIISLQSSGIFLAPDSKIVHSDGSTLFGDTSQSIILVQGSNARAGTATLVAGTVDVANTSVTANSLIFLTVRALGGTIGIPYTSNIVAGTGFTVNSSSILDTSLVSWIIFEQIPSD